MAKKKRPSKTEANEPLPVQPQAGQPPRNQTRILPPTSCATRTAVSTSYDCIESLAPPEPRIVERSAHWGTFPAVGTRAEGDKVPIYRSGGKLQIGDMPPISLEGNAELLVGYLVEHGTANSTELRTKANVDKPARVLDGLLDNYPVLNAFIGRPGRKGRGGYWTTIRRA
ncbi:MAG: hypothetical protein ACYC35_27330 [Pirellulales bacterium]